VRALGGTYQFIEFDLDGFGIAVLAALDQEHHQKGDDGGCGVDHQLSRIAEPEQGAGHDPGQDGADRQNEHDGAPAEPSGGFGELGIPGFAGHVLPPYEVGKNLSIAYDESAYIRDSNATDR
jgi:hypothetical protein